MSHQTHQMILARGNREVDLKMIGHNANHEQLRQQMINTHGTEWVEQIERGIANA